MKLISNHGEVLVDPKRCPALHRAMTRAGERVRKARAAWQRVVDARREGHDETADRIAAKLMGIQGPPMSEEKKQELRAYYEAHKEEIAARRRAKAAAKKRMKEVLKARRRR